MSFSINCLNSAFGPSICSWPTISSRVLGLVRSANGFAASRAELALCFFVNDDEDLAVCLGSSNDDVFLLPEELLDVMASTLAVPDEGSEQVDGNGLQPNSTWSSRCLAGSNSSQSELSLTQQGHA